MPCGAVHPRFVARMNVLARPAAPALAARDEFELHHAFGAQKHGDFAVESLRSVGHEDSAALFERGRDFRLARDLREMRRSNLFFAFRDENEIDRKLASRAADGM